MSGKHSYWQEFNSTDSYLDVIDSRKEEAEKNKNWITAVIIQAAYVEAMLRALIQEEIAALAIVREKDFSHFKKYTANPKTRFSSLIEYAHLLMLDQKLVQDLQTFWDQRSNIIHGLLHFKSVEELNIEAEKCFRTGIKIHDCLFDKAKSATVKRHQCKALVSKSVLNL